MAKTQSSFSGRPRVPGPRSEKLCTIGSTFLRAMLRANLEPAQPLHGRPPLATAIVALRVCRLQSTALLPGFVLSRSCEGSASAMAARLERCEAFTPAEPDEAVIARYERNGAFVPLLSKMMLSLQEDPVARNEQLKAHLESVGERSAVRQIVYDLMLLAQKQRLHALLAQWYERLIALAFQPSGPQVSLLAYHAERSGARAGGAALGAMRSAASVEDAFAGASSPP